MILCLPLCISDVYIAEFTTLKQKWQQGKVKSYAETDGQEILPGFTGRRYN